MTDTLKDVLTGTKRIEAILEEKFAATGRGLYEKMDSANMKLPEPLQKRIRYVATLRNKAMHQDGFEIDNIAEYLKTCQSIAAQLEQLHATRRPTANSQTSSESGGFMRKVFMLGAAGAGIFALSYLGMATALKFGPPASEVAGKQMPVTSQSTTRPQTSPAAPTERPVQKVAEAAQPAPKIAPSAQRAAPSPVEQDTGGRPASATGSTAPVTFANLQFGLGEGRGLRSDPHASAIFTNHHSSTISSLRVHMRLFVNGESSPIAGGTSKDGVFYVFFGAAGLAPGQSAKGTMSFFGFDHRTWKVPDVVNAQSRVVEMKLLSAEDGRKKQVSIPPMGWQR